MGSWYHNQNEMILIYGPSQMVSITGNCFWAPDHIIYQMYSLKDFNSLLWVSSKASTLSSRVKVKSYELIKLARRLFVISVELILIELNLHRIWFWFVLALMFAAGKSLLIHDDEVLLLLIIITRKLERKNRQRNAKRTIFH